LNRRLSHVPALDGLRGIAIATVVLTHTTGWPPGGYLGVDLFFVLSGFLITTLLLEEHTATGTISIRRFYMRRARRLLPALFLLIGVYTAVEFAQGRDPAGPALEGFFYCSNFFLGRTDPLAPLWSLAQEEQFYLVWPLLLAFMLRRGKRVESGLIAAFTVSTVLALVIGWHHPVAGAYSPLTRADGLIVGCLLAIARANGASLLAAARWVLIIGTAPVCYWALTTSVLGYQRFFELPVTVVVFAAAVLLAVESPATAKILSVKPLVALGGISYSLYLWHDPILFAFHKQEMMMGAAGIFTVPVAGAAAWLSTRYVEAPFRRSPQRPTRTGRAPSAANLETV